MGVSRKSRLIAVLVAVVMVMLSATAVFAANEEMSTTQGTNNHNKSYVSVAKGTIKVVTDGKILKTNKGKIKGKKITKLKEGNLVKFTTTEGDVYRWVKTTKIKKAKKGKVTWKKVKSKYLIGYAVRITDKNGKVTWKKVGKKKTSLKVKNGCKVCVRPLAKKGGKVYSGALCKEKKVKKK